MRELDDITGGIVDASLRIHRDLGPGLLESVYETILARVLDKRGFHVQRHQAFRFEYEGMVFEEAFRPDLVVEHQVIVELNPLNVWRRSTASSSSPISGLRTDPSAC